MVSTVGITDTIKSLSDLQTRCHLHQAEDENLRSPTSSRSRGSIS
jgi:hypothetical protein